VLAIAILSVSHCHRICLVLYCITSYLVVSIYILDYLSSLIHKCSKLCAHGVRLIGCGGVVEAAAGTGVIGTGGLVREEGSGGRGKEVVWKWVHTCGTGDSGGRNGDDGR